jgi:hypothetical protein
MIKKYFNQDIKNAVTLLAFTLLLGSCKYQELAVAVYPDQLIYLPASVGGVYVVDKVVAPNSVGTIGATRYAVDLGAKKFNIPLAVSRSGTSYDGDFSATLAANTDTITKLIAANSPLMAGIELLPTANYAIPASVTGASGKDIARIDASGMADITTVIPTAVAYANNPVRAAVSENGNSFNISSNGTTATTGVQNATFGDPSTLTSILTKDCRGIGLYGGTFYAYTAGTGTIEGGGNSFVVPPQPPATAINGDLTQFVFLDIDPAVSWAGTGFDVLYCADRNSGIRKLVYDGSTWAAKGVAGFLAIGLAPSGGVQTLTGRLENGKPALYFTKSTAPYSGSYLIKVVDNAGTGIWDGAGLVASPTYTNLASTDATERFIGVAFTPGSSLSLPVDLVSFKGSLINNKAHLEWVTASERNVKEFVVEKSRDAKGFSTIGTVAPTNRSTTATYDFDDANLNESINYYRLKMVDNDGSFKYSNVIAIKLGGKITKGVSVFPNPVSNNINIIHAAAEEGAIIRIVSITGSTVAQYTVAKDATQTSVDASQLMAGQYFINYISKGTLVTTSFVK